MAKYYYAVKKGRSPGIYMTWDECRDQVTGFKGAIFKKFSTVEEARDFVEKRENSKIDLSKDTLIAYVDGSYRNDTKEFSYGMVLIDQEDEIYFKEKFSNSEYSEHRNVAGEVIGSIKAIEYGLKNKYKKVYIHFDYLGIREWALGNWKANKKLTQKYKSYFDSIKDRIEIEFVKVKAHSNDKYNDMADSLAKEALGI